MLDAARTLRRKLSWLCPLVVGPLFGQTPVPLMLQGDPIPGMGNLVRVDGVWVDNRGTWYAAIRDSNQERALLREGVPYMTASSLGVNSISGFGETDVDDRGDAVATVFHSNTATVFHASTPLVSLGDPIAHPSVGAGAGHGQFRYMRFSPAQRIALLSRTSGAADHVLWRFVAEPGASLERVVGEGDLLPGQTSPVASLPHTSGIDWHPYDLNRLGQVAFWAELQNGEQVLYREQTLVAQSNMPSAVSPHLWEAFRTVSHNTQGQVAFVGRLAGVPAATNEVLVNAGQVLLRKGFAAPGLPGSSIWGFFPFGIEYADTGESLHGVYVSGFQPGIIETLFVNDEMVAYEGMPVAGSTLLMSTLSSELQAYSISDNGAYVVFRGALQGFGVNGVFLLDRRLGQTSCGPGVANNTGAPAELQLSGSSIAGGQPLLLGCRDLPPGELAMFLTSRTPALVPGAGGSLGTLCLGGQVGRFRLAAGPASLGGYREIAVDTVNLPTVPVGAALPGQTWYFQCWYRDPQPAPASNFSDAVGLMFQ